MSHKSLAFVYKINLFLFSNLPQIYLAATLKYYIWVCHNVHIITTAIEKTAGGVQTFIHISITDSKIIHFRSGLFSQFFAHRLMRELASFFNFYFLCL